MKTPFPAEINTLKTTQSNGAMSCSSPLQQSTTLPPVLKNLNLDHGVNVSWTYKSRSVQM